MKDFLITSLATVIVALFFPYMWRLCKHVGEVITNAVSDSLVTAISEYKNAWKEFIEDFKSLFVSKRKKTINKPIPIAKNVQVKAEGNGVKIFFELPTSDPVAKKLIEDIEKGSSTSFELCTDNKENSNV